MRLSYTLSYSLSVSDEFKNDDINVYFKSDDNVYNFKR